MKRTGRRSEVAVSLAVVAVFAALWVLEFGIGAPPEPGYAASVVVVALVAAPWLIAAARLLWRGWWARPALVSDGRVASGRFARAGVVTAGRASDRQGELVEGDCQPPLHRFLDCQLVVPAANVLDEGVSGDHDPGAVLLPEPAHRS
jgi:hypothetical protein